MKKYKFVILLFLSLMTLFSCVIYEKEVEIETFTRTIVVYLGRDNDLFRQREEKIKYMLDGWSGKNGHLIIYQDIAGENARLMEAYKQDSIGDVRIIEEYKNDNSANPQTLSRVIHDAMSLYPADSYGLIVFSHATGWLPENTFVSPRSLIPDQNDKMELAGFASAIPNGTFDFIIFEACYMAGIEVAYELKDKTRYILASSTEVLSPGFAEVYASSMDYLFEVEPNLKGFTQNLYSLFNTEEYYNSCTFSLIKTAELPALKSFLQASIDKEKMKDINIPEIQRFDTYSKGLFFDFEDYFSRILKDDVSSNQLSLLTSNCIMYKAATPSFKLSGGFTINRHSGFTTYIEQERFPYLNESYKELSWRRELF
ncbi:hypothetical protein M2459_001189 [Parabacteroides sp. PF5-5]|uniref:clostripain-related cysteine peptidase n=1 Tax=unclassified Parabacteroides TaxID=2649774 RepID=UPI002475543D|nr:MULTISPECIES: clostripain-related cysteine peptidase [unclassified Parabacteroides]MDH6304456.1 hypothetical protein [Parabacteroides sp. PH5-39]MDH6315391.1 hypothetical protein [Parabacteroides sp. PF5-13]MDH6319115.1 hypothetical protein [Parabacteroides sp. PH5-13]MDH6322845.1 hypothetical protein [Parabacteroides sp. PH5-8]MDH6326583.1 hypothetical protein [Parabacteroides sp. PH5-41]